MMVESILDILLSYQGVISGQTNLALFANSQHPLIKALITTREYSLNKMLEYSNFQSAYRPQYGDKYSTLVSVISSFASTILDQKSIFDKTDADDLNRMTDADMKMKVAQMDSFFALVHSFCHLI
ncbi:unnamed protein product [Gongylonema pulchrum]|uniref:Exocyst complex component 7 n=1 Tax=Gongylonema pulchrum TaxID=637853 RepID=A0A183D3D4_9BILA|nr:unnamed protein product [Gongylonema pulchrum]